MLVSIQRRGNQALTAASAESRNDFNVGLTQMTSRLGSVSRNLKFDRLVVSRGSCHTQLSTPHQRPSGLILRHSGFEEVLFLLQIDQLAHPWERVGGAGV